MRALSSLTVVVFLLLAAPAGAALSTNQSGWLWGSPEPQGQTLHELELQGSDRLRGGRLRDAPAHERRRDELGHRADRAGRSPYNVLDVIDANSVVVGNGCAARRTDDGGETFRRLPFGSGVHTVVDRGLVPDGRTSATSSSRTAVSCARRTAAVASRRGPSSGAGGTDQRPDVQESDRRPRRDEGRRHLPDHERGQLVESRVRRRRRAQRRAVHGHDRRRGRRRRHVPRRRRTGATTGLVRPRSRARRRPPRRTSTAFGAPRRRCV